MTDREQISEGSYVIERHTYIRPKGGEGIQWIIGRIEDGKLRHLAAKNTLREAADLVRRAGGE